MKKIIIDAMGGDNGSPIVIEAIKNFLSKHQDVEITAVGKKEELQPLEGLCKIIDAPDVVPMDAGALEVMHLRNSSMMKALKAYKDEGYDAVVSCGSTGGFLSASTLTLKMIPGVKRAALVTSFPSQIKGKKIVFLDIGANNENSAEELVQFATIGSLYRKAVFGGEQPKIYLLSNGTEEEKGAPEVKEAHRMMKEMNYPGFMGNIEAVNALNGDADVVVCGGFAGNIFLKSSEGIAKFMGKMIKSAFKKNLWTKLGYLHVRKGMKEMTETMDYKSTGGAMLLGVNGVVVKAHGNSEAYAFECAIDVAYKLAKAEVVEKIKEGMKDNA